MLLGLEVRLQLLLAALDCTRVVLDRLLVILVAVIVLVRTEPILEEDNSEALQVIHQLASAYTAEVGSCHITPWVRLRRRLLNCLAVSPYHLVISRFFSRYI